MLEAFTKETFTPHVGAVFTLRVSAETTVAVRLAAVEGKGGGAPAGEGAGAARREQFSLLFAGPREPRLPQRIYALEHAVLGTLELFLVPIAESESGRTYEAAFT